MVEAKHPFWHEVVLDFPCTTCNAAPGEPCTTSNGIRKYEVHGPRSAAASAAGWEFPPGHEPETVDG